MDKKNTIIGLLLLAAAFGMMFYQGQQQGTMDIIPDEEEAPAPAAQAPLSEGLITRSPASASIFESIQEAPLASVKSETVSVNEELFTLENDYIKVTFTSEGGGIKDVALKKYKNALGSEAPFVFNANNPNPALSLAFKGRNGYLDQYKPNFQVLSQSKETILFSSETKEGVKILRGYSIEKDDKGRDPYVIVHETRFTNGSSEAFNLKDLYVGMGSFPPTKGDTFGEYLNVGHYNGKDDDFIKVKSFKASNGILGIGKREAKTFQEKDIKHLSWGSVKNQFFASVLTPKDPAVGIYAQPLEMPQIQDEDLDEGITGSMKFSFGQLLPSETKLLAMDFYVGPKEYKRLEALGQDQDLIMQFGFFGMISKLLLIIMTAVNSFVPNWGLTIIIVTIFIKLVLWPLTNMQVRSSKRMQKIQEPMKALKEKYKNSPQKLQMETMKLFKEHRVNPAAGCLPLFVQLPIFLGLYFMLRSASELRFASFLWIPDLSVPDTIAYISGFPVNILPLLMAVSMFFQMRLMPSPMTDSAQKKIFQLMPFIFLVFCYNFPAGLVLYWTVQNLLTILQQSITSRMSDPMDSLPAPVVQKAKKKTSRKRKK